MKYFTPELLTRCRALDDDVADAASAEWELAIERYRERLDSILSELPPAVRQLIKRINLHDAHLLTLKTSNTGKDLILTFRLAQSTPATAGGVELRYTLAEPPVVERSSGSGETSIRTRHVQYDEFDSHDEELAVFSHSLLLTGGLEIRVRFSAMRLTWFSQVELVNGEPLTLERVGASEAQ